MCGIAGSVGQRSSPERMRSVLRMRDALHHRGPDAGGEWEDQKGLAAFAHARLSIIDLSLGGAQPKISPDGRYSIVFNGEIFNYRELRDELRAKGVSFRSESDTEVLLYAYIAWGEACVSKINGMFAFAVWDTKEEEVFIARDPMGEKPLVYTLVDGSLLFASEVKGILAHAGVPQEIDWSVIPDVLSLRFVPAPRTGLKNIFKLPAGHTLLWSKGQARVRRYIQRDQDVGLSARDSMATLTKTLWSTFTDAAVSRLLASDVPVGAFLSGGIDSSSVVAALAHAGFSPKTYCIAVGGENEDIRAARVVAKQFGLEKTHEEIIVPDEDLERMVRNVAQTYDEPFADQSSVPSLLVSEAMKKHSTVVLGGDGADELFGGYDTYQHMRLFSAYATLPSFFRAGVANMVGMVSKNMAYPLEIMTGTVPHMYTRRFSLWKDTLPISKRYVTQADLFTPEFQHSLPVAESTLENWLHMYAAHSPLQAALLADQEGRLPDGYLYKVDMASMRSALEVRSPFLDPRVVALANRIPASLHVRGQGKWVWRQVVSDILPEEVLTRQKRGFSMPLDRLFREKFGVFAKEVLLSQTAETRGVFSAKTVARVFEDHMAKKADYSNHLWALLMIELWVQHLKK